MSLEALKNIYVNALKTFGYIFRLRLWLGEAD